MKPTHKSYSLNQAINAFLGVDREESIHNDICVFCHKPAKEFRDDISRKEFSISGICQECQDQTYGS